MFSGSWSQTPGEHSLNSFLCGCSPEGGSRHRENIPGAGFCVNVLRRVVPDTRRTLAEHIFAWMFSGGWFRTPGEHYWNCECSPEGGSRHRENMPRSNFCVNVLRKVVPDTRRTFVELISVSMFSGRWFQTPGEHSWNGFLCECSREGGSKHPKNIRGSHFCVDVLRRVVPDARKTFLEL